MSSKQVYFNLLVTASIPAESNQEELALLQAHYKINDFTTKVKELKLCDVYTGDEIENLQVHEVYVDWEDLHFDDTEE